LRQTAKAEAYIRFSQQLNTRANSVNPKAFGGFNAPGAQKHQKIYHDGGKQFKSMTLGRDDVSKQSSIAPF